MRQPRLEECPNICRLEERDYYGVPEGIFRSALKKDNVDFGVTYSKNGTEKIIFTTNWYFCFRRGGKNKGWLCFDCLVY